MDGVLVDVTESYRETIAQTVKHFTGVDVTREQIQDYKNQGGWNDDWKLSHHIITTAGTDVPFETAKDYFQSIFLGNGEGGLILREAMGRAPRRARRAQPAISSSPSSPDAPKPRPNSP